MSNSTIFDLSDVRKPIVPLSVLEGYILKWNNISKKWQLMQDNQGIGSDVDSARIENGNIVKSVIDLSTKIPLTKLMDLPLMVTEKFQSLAVEIFLTLVLIIIT